MTELQKNFESASQQVQNLSSRPDNQTLLELYGLYKQATIGDVVAKRPGFTDPVGRAKFDGWSKYKGMGKDAAMQAYIDLDNRLISR